MQRNRALTQFFSSKPGFLPRLAKLGKKPGFIKVLAWQLHLATSLSFLSAPTRKGHRVELIFQLPNHDLDLNLFIQRTLCSTCTHGNPSMPFLVAPPLYLSPGVMDGLEHWKYPRSSTQTQRGLPSQSHGGGNGKAGKSHAGHPVASGSRSARRGAGSRHAAGSGRGRRGQQGRQARTRDGSSDGSLAVPVVAVGLAAVRLGRAGLQAAGARRAGVFVVVVVVLIVGCRRSGRGRGHTSAVAVPETWVQYPHTATWDAGTHQ